MDIKKNVVTHIAPFLLFSGLFLSTDAVSNLKMYSFCYIKIEEEYGGGVACEQFCPRDGDENFEFVQTPVVRTRDAPLASQIFGLAGRE